MFQTKRFWLLLVFAVWAADACSGVGAEEMGVEDAWKALPKYRYGQDMAPLLAIDRAVIQAMASSETRSVCAARLAAVLGADETTLAARQYICFQLRQIGTPAEVPVLARLLQKRETSQTARYALEAIPGEESLAALRDALATLKGDLLVGVINSVGARKDLRCVARLQCLAESQDKQVALAAFWALGNVAGDEATAFLIDRAEKVGIPTPRDVAVPLLRSADALAAAGKTEQAQAVYARLSQAGQVSGVRRAAFEGLLRLQQERAAATILAWVTDADADRRLVAAGHLDELSDEQLDTLAMQLADLPNTAKLTLIEVLVSRRAKDTLPLVMSLARSDKPELKLTGIRCLGLVGDISVGQQVRCHSVGQATALLIDTLSAGGELTEAAQQALSSLPRKEVGEALLEALGSRPDLRIPVIEVLKKLKYYEAIDPLIAIAAQEDPAVYEPALDGLRGIADPDKHDIPRLVKLLLNTPRGSHRDEVEKTILIVCDKLPAAADPAEPVLEALAQVDPSESVEYLPLLGRLGGPKALKTIESALGSTDAKVQEAAVRALCNWPDAEVADRLLEIVTGPVCRGHTGCRGHIGNKAFRHWALRAYVRVVSLKSNRPEAETLAMLQKAMQLAENTDDKRLVLQRASTVRTMETVAWIAQYLDDPALAQAACEAIVELGHHRFLRHPNITRFAPILEKVSRISNDPAVVERAKRYRLGL